MAAVLLASAGVVAPLTPARAEPPASARAQDARAECRVEYSRGEYLLAIEACKAAYRAEPDPDLLYSIAQAARRAGENDLAVAFYRAFLDAKGPSYTGRSVVEARIREAEEARVAAPASLPASRPAAAQPAVTTRPSSLAEASRPLVPPRASTPSVEPGGPPWYGGATGLVLLSSGAAGVASGAALLGLAVSEGDAASSAQDLSAFHARAELAREEEVAGIAFGTAGLALAATGLWVARSERRATDHAAAVAVLVLPAAGAALGIGGRF